MKIILCLLCLSVVTLARPAKRRCRSDPDVVPKYDVAENEKYQRIQIIGNFHITRTLLCVFNPNGTENKDYEIERDVRDTTSAPKRFDG